MTWTTVITYLAFGALFALWIGLAWATARGRFRQGQRDARKRK